MKNSTVEIRPQGGFQQYWFSKSIGICCGILKNSTVKIRPPVLLCQNPTPATSGLLEEILPSGLQNLPSGLQNLPSGRLRTALGQILESLGQILEALGQDFLQNPSGRGWIFYHNCPHKMLTDDICNMPFQVKTIQEVTAALIECILSLTQFMFHTITNSLKCLSF